MSFPNVKASRRSSAFGVVSLLFVVSLGASATVATQGSRPVFTGTWKFAADKSNPSTLPALGTEFRITHEANALVLELPVTEFITEKDRPTRTVDAGLGAPMAYRTDGAEHVMEPRSPLLPTDDDRVLMNFIPGGPYRASWKDSSLVIASSDVIPQTSVKSGRIEFAHRLISTTFSMNPDGTLVVERTTERDPSDKGQFVLSKTVQTSLYRKAP